MKMRPNVCTPETLNGAARSVTADPTEESPSFYIISVYGQTYLVAAGSSNAAAVVLAETLCLATDPADWTIMQDDMFEEVIPVHPLHRQILSREQYLELCRHKPGYVEVVAVCARS